jgi:CheY-specific phosphatase CheX
MSYIQVRNKLTVAHTGKGSPLFPLISGKTRLAQPLEPGFQRADALWRAEWWGLEASKTFSILKPQLQKSVLEACNRTVLNEAYFIEKSGLAYTSKMVLLAESTDVAQLYALIGADEARHLAWLELYVADEDKTRPNGQFLAFLSSLIEEAPPRLLVYLVQIILEGWGLDHYKRLADGCQNTHLTEVLLNILKDEALHHKSGSLLFKPTELQPEDWELIRSALISYASMVRVGCWTVIQAMEKVLDALSVQEEEDVLIARKHSEECFRKLQLLKKLACVEPKVKEIKTEADYQAYGDISGMIGISGDRGEGMISLSFLLEVGSALVAKLLGIMADKLSSGDRCDGVGELVNMISGSAKSMLSKDHHALYKLSLPTVIQGKDHQISSRPKNCPYLVIIFEVEQKTFHL